MVERGIDASLDRAPPGSTQPTRRSTSTSSIRSEVDVLIPGAGRTFRGRDRGASAEHCRQDAARGNGHHGVPRHRAQRGTRRACSPRSFLRAGTSIQRMSSRQGRVDVEVESKRPDELSAGKAHPNTCPSCGSHYRDDELGADAPGLSAVRASLPVGARDRIEQLVDPGRSSRATTSAWPIRRFRPGACTRNVSPRRRSRPGSATRSCAVRRDRG